MLLALKVTVLPFHALEQPGGNLLSFTAEKLLPSRVARLCKVGIRSSGVSVSGREATRERCVCLCSQV